MLSNEEQNKIEETSKAIVMIENAIELVENKDYIGLSGDMDIWNEGIHLFLDTDMPFDVSFDEFVISDEFEIIEKDMDKSFEFQNEMKSWLNTCLYFARSNLVEHLKTTDIHCHLDGSLSPEIMKEIALKDNIDIDLSLRDGTNKDIKDCSIEEIRFSMMAGGEGSNLVDYLQKFYITNQLMKTGENLALISKDIVKQLVNDNVVYSEIRFAPHLHLSDKILNEKDRQLDLEFIVRNVVSTIKKETEDKDIEVNVILCVLRSEETEQSKKIGDEIIGLAEKFKNKGVVAIDIAGDEFLYSVKNHSKMLYNAKDKGIKTTIHSGEADGVKSVRNSLKLSQEDGRIGHGVRIIEEYSLSKIAGDKQVPFEICINSNLQTNVTLEICDEKTPLTMENYPLKSMLNKGMKCSINTDNRLVSDTTIKDEILTMLELKNINLKDIVKMINNGIETSFGTKKEKRLTKELLENNHEILKIFKDIKNEFSFRNEKNKSIDL